MKYLPALILLPKEIFFFCGRVTEKSKKVWDGDS